MMSKVDLLISFWGYALEIVAYFLNNVPTKSIYKTSYEIWRGMKPNLSYTRIWGFIGYVKCASTDKLGVRSEKCTIVKGVCLETFNLLRESFYFKGQVGAR